MTSSRFLSLGISVSALCALGTASASGSSVAILPTAEIAGTFNPEAQGVICSDAGCQLIQDFPVVQAALGTTNVSAVAPGATANISATIKYSSNPDDLRSVSETGTVSVASVNGLTSLDDNPSLSYNFELFGPTSTVMGQVIGSGGVSFSGGAPGLNDPTMSASLQVLTPLGGALIDDVARVAVGLPTLPNFSESGTYTFETDQVYTVNLALLVAGGVLGSFGGGTETLSAFVDPHIVLPDGYSVVLSPAPGIPEPTTWAMMLLGFVGLGLAGYRASRNAAALAA